jgi:hypothetical protein
VLASVYFGGSAVVGLNTKVIIQELSLLQRLSIFVVSVKDGEVFVVGEVFINV